MAIWGNWVVPTLNSQPYLEKPPLFYLMGVLSCKIAGTFAPWALRLPSAVMAILTVMWVSWLGCRVRSARAGFWAGVLVATQVLFFQMGHRAVVDMAFTAMVTLALGLAYLAVTEESSGLWVNLFWASQGLVFLAKGVIGPVMVLGPVAAVLALSGDRRKVRAFLKPGWGMGVGAGLVLAWVVPLALKGGREFLTEVFVRNTVGRFIKHPGFVPRTGTLEEHREPFYFYLVRTPGNVLPWLALWLASLAPSRRWRRDVGEWAIPAIFLATLILLSASSGKRMVYILPVLPITFLHTGLWLDSALREGMGRALKIALWTSVALTLILGAGLPWFVVARVGMPWPPALAMSLASLALGAVAVTFASRRRFPPALGWSMAQWSVAILAFLLLGVPYLDREWNPLQEPYKAAKSLEDQGAMVFQGRLSETQVGFINLTFGHTLAAVATPEEVKAALARAEPVVLLLDVAALRKGRYGPRLEGAVELPTEASRSKNGDRAPVVLLNHGAVELMENSRDLRVIAANRRRDLRGA